MTAISGTAPQRATKTYVMRSPAGDFFFSYDTCIAAAISNGPGEAPTKVRLDNKWGPTTGRHMDEMGVSDFPVVSQEDFDAAVSAAFAHQRHPGAQVLAGRIDSGEIEAGPLEKQWAATVLNKVAADAEAGDLWVDLAELKVES